MRLFIALLLSIGLLWSGYTTFAGVISILDSNDSTSDKDKPDLQKQEVDFPILFAALTTSLVVVGFGLGTKMFFSSQHNNIPLLMRLVFVMLWFIAIGFDSYTTFKGTTTLFGIDSLDKKVFIIGITVLTEACGPMISYLFTGYDHQSGINLVILTDIVSTAFSYFMLLIILIIVLALFIILPIYFLVNLTDKTLSSEARQSIQTSKIESSNCPTITSMVPNLIRNGMRIQTTDGGGRPINLRSSPYKDKDDDNLLTAFPKGEQGTVIDGPICNVFRWFFIDFDNGTRGWMAEGGPVYYYIERIN